MNDELLVFLIACIGVLMFIALGILWICADSGWCAH